MRKILNSRTTAELVGNLEFNDSSLYVPVLMV
jgi:hypothetical protein